MEQKIEIQNLKEWIGELYLEKKALEKALQEQSEVLEKLTHVDK